MQFLNGMSLTEWWAWLTVYKKICLIVVYGLGVICLPIMKKIQPDTFWAYLAYVVIVEIFFTAFALCLSAAELAQ